MGLGLLSYNSFNPLTMPISIVSGNMTAKGHFPAGAQHLVTVQRSATDVVNMQMEVYESGSLVATLMAGPDIGSSGAEFTFDMASIPRQRLKAHKPGWSQLWGSTATGQIEQVTDTYKWYNYKFIEQVEDANGIRNLTGGDEKYYNGLTDVSISHANSFAFHWASHADEANGYDTAFGSIPANYSDYLMASNATGDFLTNRDSFTLHDPSDYPLWVDFIASAPNSSITIEAKTYLGSTVVSTLTGNMEALPLESIQTDGDRFRVDISPDWNQAFPNAGYLTNMLTELQNGTADNYTIQFKLVTDEQTDIISELFRVYWKPKCSRRGADIYYSNPFGAMDFLSVYSHGDEILDIEQDLGIRNFRTDAHDNAGLTAWDASGNYALHKRNRFVTRKQSSLRWQFETIPDTRTQARSIYRELMQSTEVWIRPWGQSWLIPVVIDAEEAQLATYANNQAVITFDAIYSRPHISQ